LVITLRIRAPSLTLTHFTTWVGHTGKYDAAVSAITHTDAAVGTVYDAYQAAGCVFFPLPSVLYSLSLFCLFFISLSLIAISQPVI
jgi:hypothetical protein